MQQPRLECYLGPRWQYSLRRLAWPQHKHSPCKPICLTRIQSSAQASVMTEALDINMDPGCCRGVDPDMSPDSNPGQMSSCPPRVSAQATQINMAPGAAQPMNITMATGDGHTLGIPVTLVATWVMDVSCCKPKYCHRRQPRFRHHSGPG